MAFKVYTKTGDKGTTGLLGGTRVPKNHIRIEAYGTLDELNSHVGYIRTLLQNDELDHQLYHIQDRLFTLGSQLASDPNKTIKMNIPSIYEKDVVFLENKIDEMDEKLPELKSFVLAGGLPSAAYCHIARCVCRRAERLCVSLQEIEQNVPPLYIQYLNRLSDYFFVLSRYILLLNGKNDSLWLPKSD